MWVATRALDEARRAGGGLEVAALAACALMDRLSAQWGLPSPGLSLSRMRGGLYQSFHASVPCCVTGNNQPKVRISVSGAVVSPTLDAENNPGGSFKTTVWTPPQANQVRASGMKNHSG